MSNFLKAKKYYTKSEVDDYVKKMMTASEITMLEQRERILELKKENELLNGNISFLKKRERKIIKMLQEAKGYSSKVEEDIKLRCAKEIVKIKAFGLEWQKEFEKLKTKLNIDDKGKFDEFVLGVDKLSKPFADIKSNNESDIDVNRRFEIILNKVKDRAPVSSKLALPLTDIPVSESGFDFNEALNPIDPLEKILSELMEDVPEPKKKK